MKKGYKQGYNLLVLKALNFFIENPYEEIYLREFSRKLKLIPNTVQRFLNLFLREELIIEERKANSRYFKANMESILFKQIKITMAIKKVKDSKLIDFLKKQEFFSVVLFGSVAKGEDDFKSDLDLVCIGTKKKVTFHNFEGKLGREINTHLFTLAEWKKQKIKNKAFYQDVIISGINLIGELPLI